MNAGLVDWVFQHKLSAAVLSGDSEIGLHMNASELRAVVGNLEAEGDIVAEVDEREECDGVEKSS